MCVFGVVCVFGVERCVCVCVWCGVVWCVCVCGVVWCGVVCVCVCERDIVMLNPC